MVTIATISLDKFLECLKENAARIKDYDYGHDGRDGYSDCVGYVIGALRLAGINYTGTHGSNYFERKCTIDVHRVTNADQLELGEVVYKAYAPGESGWDLPSSYSKDPDQNDYYHIGVVTSVNPLVISHCSTGGMHYDNSLGKWKYAGWCIYVQGGKILKPPYIASVITQKGSLNIRSGPGTEYPKIGSVPKGASVTVKTHREEWDFIEYANTQGYVSNQYLQPIKEIPDDPTPTPEPDPEDPTMIILKIPAETARMWAEVLSQIVAVLNEGTTNGD